MSLLLQYSNNGDFSAERHGLLVLERGEGPYVFDTAGRRYIDGISSLYCAQLGYSYGHEMAAAATRQLNRLPFNTNWGTAHPPALELAERLAGLAPASINSVFFTSSGSESVEVAWKLARQYHLANDEPMRRIAIARKNAYHGMTLGALSFTDVPSMRDPFSPQPVSTCHVANTNRFRSGLDDEALCEKLLKEVSETIEQQGPENVAVIIAEPLQNAGGCLVPPRGYWAGLRVVADRYGVLLIADEVITAFGRLGEWFGSSHVGAAPDLYCLAKGLTSAHAPMGAVLAADHVVAPLKEPGRKLLHGTTFNGHPVAAAMAIKNLEIFERDSVLERARLRGEDLRLGLESLLELPIVGDVRGAGMFWALELVRDQDGGRFSTAESAQLVRGFLPGRLRDAGLIARPDDRGDSVLQLAPPLISTSEVIEDIVSRVRDVLTDAGSFMERFARA